MRIHDTAIRAKIDFVPPPFGPIRIYVCGPTVYDRIHLGNARSAVVFDLLRRVLEDEHGGGSVRMVRNITDVDDKINARASERGVPISEVTEVTARWFHEDAGELGVLAPHSEPRATRYVNEMVGMIQRIINNGHGYASRGHVFFDVSSDPGSGSLFRAGMRGEPSNDGEGIGKRSPEDFVLWKPSGPGQPSWPSPWGPGRPGWHIECSAMVRSEFGPGGVDIHGGGADLQFPHHENEEAQHRCAHPGEQFARHWMHNGMVTVDGRKMSKSEGNFITVREVLDDGFGGDAVRLALLTGHYSGSLDWSGDLIRASAGAVARWRSASVAADPVRDPVLIGALRDDLATPRAIARMFEAERAGEFGVLAFGMGLMGLDDASRAPVMRPDRELDERLSRISEERDKARAAKDWAAADRLREEARGLGFEFRDRPGGTEWEFVGTPGGDSSPGP